VNSTDRQRLRALVGLPASYKTFIPDINSNDCGMLEEWLLSAGWSISIRRHENNNYGCTLAKNNLSADPAAAWAPDRRSSISLAALALCP
jgi:hypothetical protein